MPSINICCLVIMFYLTKKSCSFDVLKIWKYNFLLVLLLFANAVRGWWERKRIQGRVPYSGKGHTKRIGYQTASIVRKWFGSMANDIPEEAHLTRTENLGWNQRVVQDFRDGIPQSKFIDNSRSKHWAVSPVSLASQPFLFPNLTLSSIQCMKNITIMNQNKHLFAHIT